MPQIQANRNIIIIMYCVQKHGVQIGVRKTMSKWDRKKLLRMYKCEGGGGGGYYGGGGGGYSNSDLDSNHLGDDHDHDHEHDPDEIQNNNNGIDNDGYRPTQSQSASPAGHHHRNNRESLAAEFESNPYFFDNYSQRPPPNRDEEDQNQQLSRVQAQDSPNFENGDYRSNGHSDRDSNNYNIFSSDFLRDAKFNNLNYF